MTDDILKQKILKTLAYFYIFHRPLTIFEVWKFLFNFSDQTSCTLTEIMETLENLKYEEIIVEKDGFYSLKKEYKIEDLLKERIRKDKIADKKYKKALRIMKILKHIDSIKMAAVCNSLAHNNAAKKSDIDLFIITQKGSIWITRLLTVGLLKVMGLRPSEKNTADKICASFFISEEKMNLEEIRILQEGKLDKEIDIYLIYWISTLVPIYNKNKTYENFIEHNKWIKKNLPNWDIYKVNDERKVISPFYKENFYFFQNNLFLTIFDIILHTPFLLLKFLISEKLARRIQILIMPPELKNLANKDTRVIINNEILKFHSNDRRKQYLKEWKDIACQGQIEIS